VFFAGQATGMMVLSTGGGKVMGSSGDLRAITRLRADALIGVPGYVYHLLRRAAAERLDLSSIKCVVLGAERVPPGMKQKIGGLLAECGAKDVRVFGTYGFTEARMAFAECPTRDNAYTGYHLYPDLAIFEVVDPVTGEVVPDGERRRAGVHAAAGARQHRVPLPHRRPRARRPAYGTVPALRPHRAAHQQRPDAANRA
jgi:phenylacetate-CoA ligase